MDTIPARFKPMQNNAKASLVLCGMRDKNGHQTCPVVFGEMWVTTAVRPAPFMRVYGLFRRKGPGVYQPTQRALDQAEAGRPLSLRRRRVLDEGGVLIDLGPSGERVAEVVRDFPVRIQCYRCTKLNEVVP